MNLQKSQQQKIKNTNPILVCFLFWLLVFIDENLLHYKNLESSAKYKYNSNYVTACVYVLIIERMKNMQKNYSKIITGCFPQSYRII